MHKLRGKTMQNQTERMRAIVAQALAEAGQNQNGRLAGITLIVYGALPDSEIIRMYEEASRGTLADGAKLLIEQAGSRFICWNCCGLRFEGSDGMCPNCGELALEVPEEIAFALRRIEVAAAS
jgi:Zn finger protein HypA/HybF involved in hydrogenase expression